MKKILATILATLMCISVFVFTACDGCGGDNDHTHSYGSWSVVTPATCTETGVREKKCSCGDVKTETIPATGHNFVAGICTECGALE